ncbi:unnamed protein product [Linum trigynum]|uniref:Transposase n=1 Tax=Linum trigynum TaxID=586398 RepID=A0AAV2D9D7_9ROSI
MEGNAGIPMPSKRKREQASDGEEDFREQFDTSRLRRHVEKHHPEMLPEDDEVEQEVPAAATAEAVQEEEEEEDCWEDFDKDAMRKHMEECHPERLSEWHSAKDEAPAAGVKGKSGADDLYGQLPGGEQLVRLAVAESLPILFKDCTLFNLFVQTMNPAYPKFSAKVLRKAAMAYYAKETESLLPVLRDLKVRVSFTSGLWSSSDVFLEGVIYLYLSCHWIDEKWEMQSRVLGFQQLDWPMEDPENVSSTITKLVLKWELEGKVLSINFDDRTNVTAAVSKLQTSFSPILDGHLFQSKCAHHIVNSCLKYGFSKISSLLDKVRNVIHFIQESNIEQQVKDKCSQSGLRYKRLLCDIPMWSNTTYEMLDAFIRYRSILMELCSVEHAAGNYCGTPLTEDEWSVLCSLTDFLERFKAAFDIFCSVYIPTANLVIPILYTLSEASAQYIYDKHVGQICAGMEAKFSTYWVDGIPMVYCLATILDPRYKLDGLLHLLDGYHANTKVSIGDTKNKIKTLFYKTYDAYFKQYVPLIPEDLVRSGCSSSGTKSAVRLVHSSRDGDGKKGSDTKASSHSEIQYYLSSDDVSSLGLEEDIDKLDMLDVLKWWKHNQARYPVLATVARDVLAHVASAKVPEDTFDFHSSGVNEQRREMGSKAAEMSVCLKDWIRAELREQRLCVNRYGGDVSSDEEENDDDDAEEEEG